MEKQRTIINPVSYSGIGLHTGNHTNMTFKPAPVNTGIQFVRVDLNTPMVIPADVDHVIDTVRGTTLGKGNVKVTTVEHVLAAVAGLGIDNCYIELDNNEPPVGDGSAQPYVEVLNQAGIVEQDQPRKFVCVEKPIWVSGQNDTHLVVLPDEEFKVTFTVDYHHPLLRSQYGSFTINPETFQKEIAPARTFCFSYEVDTLRSQGLIKGGSLENAVVIGDDKILNETPLRYEDEFVRHKILDLVGDLYLLGYPVKGHFVIARSGHTFNVALARKLRQHLNEKTKHSKVVTIKAKDKGPWTEDLSIYEYLLESSQIQNILPHRYPFLLVDRILQMDDLRAVGIKNVTINEEFFNGHFPGRPVMPGVLIIEALAQVAGVLMLSKNNNVGKLAYLLGVDNAKFRRRVIPGDQVRLEIEVTKIKGKMGKAKGIAYVDQKICAEAEMTFSLMDPEENTLKS